MINLDSIELAYFLTPTALRLAYFLWVVFLSLYWYADKHDKYNSEVLQQAQIVSTKVNFNWVFPILGGFILAVNQFFIIFEVNLNVILSKLDFFKNASVVLTELNTHFVISSVIPVIGIIFMLVGLYIAALARAVLNGYWNTNIIEYESKYKKLVTNGIYSIMRHPIYVAQFLLALGTACAASSLFVMIFPILLYKANKKRAHEEDKELERMFGDEFVKYRNKVSACGLKISGG